MKPLICCTVIWYVFVFQLLCVFLYGADVEVNAHHLLQQAREGNFEGCKDVIESCYKQRGGREGSGTEFLEMILHEASRFNNIPMVKHLLAEFERMSIPFEDKGIIIRWALITAIMLDHVEIVEALLLAYPDMNILDYFPAYGPRLRNFLSKFRLEQWEQPLTYHIFTLGDLQAMHLRQLRLLYRVSKHHHSILADMVEKDTSCAWKNKDVLDLQNQLSENINIYRAMFDIAEVESLTDEQSDKLIEKMESEIKLEGDKGRNQGVINGLLNEYREGIFDLFYDILESGHVHDFRPILAEAAANGDVALVNHLFGNFPFESTNNNAIFGYAIFMSIRNDCKDLLETVIMNLGRTDNDEAIIDKWPENKKSYLKAHSSAWPSSWDHIRLIFGYSDFRGKDVSSFTDGLQPIHMAKWGENRNFEHLTDFQLNFLEEYATHRKYRALIRKIKQERCRRLSSAPAA